MENQSTKIILFKDRSLAGRLSASLEFVEKNFKVLLKFCSIFILPIALIISFTYVYLGDPSVRLGDIRHLTPDIYGYIAYLFFVFLIYVFGLICLTSMVYTLLKEYSARESLANITFGEIKELFIANIKRFIVLCLVITLLYIPFIGLAVLCAVFSLWTLFISIPILIYLCIPVRYMQAIYLFEEISMKDAIKKGFVLGTANWGGTFLVLLLSSIFALIVQGVVSLPFAIGKLIQAQAFNSVLDGNLANLPSYFIVLMFFLGSIAYFATYLAQIYVEIAMMFQYFSVTQKAADKKAVEEYVVNE